MIERSAGLPARQLIMDSPGDRDLRLWPFRRESGTL